MHKYKWKLRQLLELKWRNRTVNFIVTVRNKLGNVTVENLQLTCWEEEKYALISLQIMQQCSTCISCQYELTFKDDERRHVLLYDKQHKFHYQLNNIWLSTGRNSYKVVAADEQKQAWLIPSGDLWLQTLKGKLRINFQTHFPSWTYHSIRAQLHSLEQVKDAFSHKTSLKLIPRNPYHPCPVHNNSDFLITCTPS